MPPPSARTTEPVPTAPTAVLPSAPAIQSPAVASTRLAISATGLGPCRQPWWSPCIYGVRLLGPGGYDHRGSFGWDPGPPPSGEMGMGTAGPVSSTGVLGDVPVSLGRGTWTLSFRLYYGSDVASYNPVPGGTPRAAEEDPFTAACSTEIDTTGVVAVSVHVAFSGAKCKVVAAVSRG